MTEYAVANTMDSAAIQSSASMPRALALTHTLMPDITAATMLSTMQTMTMVRHCEEASTSGVAFATQGIAVLREGYPRGTSSQEIPFSFSFVGGGGEREDRCFSFGGGFAFGHYYGASKYLGDVPALQGERVCCTGRRGWRNPGVMVVRWRGRAHNGGVQEWAMTTEEGHGSQA